jgi:hypothetical protein
MSSRAHSQASTERRIRRLLQRRNISMLTPKLPDAKVRAHGGYMLRDDDSGAYVFGEKPYQFSATLEEVEAWLEGAPTLD